MADEVTKKDAEKPAADTGAESRNKGMGQTDYDEKHPDPKDIHSDDPLVAGLANGARQSDEDTADTGSVGPNPS